MAYLRNILRRLVVEAGLFFSSIVIYFPDGSLGNKMREWYYRWRFQGRVGKNPRFGAGFLTETWHTYPVKIEIGDNFIASGQVIIDPSDSLGIIIGNDVAMPHGVYVRSASHNYSSLERPIMKQGHIAKKVFTKDGRAASIIIEDDVYFGAYSIVLTGAKIGRGSVIAAGSVVASEIPEYSVVMGNPARVIASRTKSQFMSGYEVFP